MSKAEKRRLDLSAEAVPLGSRKRVELPVGRLPTGAWLRLPISIVRGARAGPTIWLSAAVHGDELNGVAIVHRILGALDAQVLSGTVIAVPALNVFGLVSGSRYLPDRRDLNRSFPGSATGSLASRLAHLFLTQVASQCEVGIDFHTGSNGRVNLPQIRCDLENPAASALAAAFAAPITLHAKIRDGSMRGACGELGIPCILFEGGESMRLLPEVTNLAVQGALRTLVHLKMLTADDSIDVPGASMVCSSSRWTRSARGGFFERRCELGDMVSEGDSVGQVFDLTGQERHVVSARSAGVIVGHLATAIVNRGDAVVHIAEPTS